MLIAHAALSDAASLSATTENPNYPLENLQNMQPSQVYRSTAVTGQDIDIDLGAAYALDLFALVNCNLTLSGTVRVRVADSQSNLSAAPSYDSTALGFTAPLSQRNRAFYNYKSAPVTDRWVRFTLEDATNTDGFLEIGRLIVAGSFIPSRNYSYGGGIGYIEASQTTESQGGQIYVHERPRRKYLEIEANITKAEALTSVLDLDRDRGGAKDYLVMLDADDAAYVHQQSIYGLSQELAPIIRPHLNHFIKRYRFEEIL